MEIVVGIVSAALWILYAGQVISVVDFSLAQRLGLQEKSDEVDPLFSSLELWTARWDLWSLWVLPVAGILMLVDHEWWPYVAMVGGGAYIDCGGREGAKVLGLRRQGVRTGSARELRVLISAYMFLLAVGGLAIVAGLIEVA